MEVIVFIVFVFWLIWGGVFDGWDDSDEKHEEGMRRRSSDLAVKYDYGTGLQYLVGPFGGVTPRLDADGNHMKIPEEELERKPERKWLSRAFYALLIFALVFFGIPAISG